MAGYSVYEKMRRGKKSKKTITTLALSRLS